ncbi:MAG: sulfate/thiosulfate ABC transporter permease CysW, partial [Verrucomicrobiota bacterium]
MSARSEPITRRRESPVVPVSILLLVLLPLLLLPLSAVFIFAFRGGVTAFGQALTAPDAQFALRFSVLIAFATALVNAVLGTFAAYVLSKHQFRGKASLNIVVNLPVAIPTVVVGTSLLLLWGPIGLLGRLLQPLGLQPMFTPIGVLLAHLFVTFPYML